MARCSQRVNLRKPRRDGAVESTRLCKRKGVVVRDGRHWCRLHAPYTPIQPPPDEPSIWFIRHGGDGFFPLEIDQFNGSFREACVCATEIAKRTGGRVNVFICVQTIQPVGG